MLAKLALAILLFRLTQQLRPSFHAHIAGNMAAVCCLMGPVVAQAGARQADRHDRDGAAASSTNTEPSLTVTRLRKRALRLATYLPGDEFAASVA